jgi:hypothetical protein
VLGASFPTDRSADLDPRVPVLTSATPYAVRLPATIVTSTLPPTGPATVGSGRFGHESSTWRVSRWWRPDRPVGLVPPCTDLSGLEADVESAVGVPEVSATYDGLRPERLVGRGPGLTPAGDDVLAGALVAANATSDPRLRRWRSTTLGTLGVATTTAVSRALLHHACDGYAAPELARFLVAVCGGGGGDVTAARDRLLAVGHVSGAALMAGALHTLSTHRLEGAA